MPSAGAMAGIGGLAAAGMSYYAAMHSKKNSNAAAKAAKKGMSLDNYLAMAKSKKHNKMEKKAMKHGMTPEQYMGQRSDRYNAKMTSLYGPFTGTLPAALLGSKMHKKGKKHKKNKGYRHGGGSSSSGSSGSGSSDSD